MFFGLPLTIVLNTLDLSVFYIFSLISVFLYRVNELKTEPAFVFSSAAVVNLGPRAVVELSIVTTELWTI